MAQLIVRNIDDELVKELKLRAAQNARSAEEEHRQILRRALQVKTRSLKELLSTMPDVGDDRDFERTEDRGRDIDW